MNKEYILNLLQKARKDCVEFEQKYQGGGLYKKIKRLLKYKGRYLEYALAKLGINRKFSFLSYFGILNMGLREIKTAEFFIKNIKPGDVFYDIGANQGFFSLLIKEAFGDKVEVHSFEPVEQYFQIIQERFKNNLNKNNIYLNQLALSDHIGDLELKVPAKMGFNSTASILDDFAERYFKKYKEIKVKCTTLDDYCTTHKYPTFIKIDVDGSESFVIDGATTTLSKYGPVICMEIMDGDMGMKYSLKAVNKLINFGYKIFHIDDDQSNDLIEFSLGDLIDYIKIPKGDNFVFAKEKL
jgi:FkbM family methyltransferase